MFAFESFFGYLKRLIHDRGHTVANIINSYDTRRRLNAVRALLEVVGQTPPMPLYIPRVLTDADGARLVRLRRRRSRLHRFTPEERDGLQKWMRTLPEYQALQRKHNARRQRLLRYVRFLIDV
jgi:hypothetical protein